MEKYSLIPRQASKSTLMQRLYDALLHATQNYEFHMDDKMDSMYEPEPDLFLTDSMFGDINLPFIPDEMFGEEDKFTLRTYELTGSPIREMLNHWIKGVQEKEDAMIFDYLYRNTENKNGRTYSKETLEKAVAALRDPNCPLRLQVQQAESFKEYAESDVSEGFPNDKVLMAPVPSEMTRLYENG